jgi:hypothetical protein
MFPAASTAVSEKSLLHEKLFEKNAAVAKGFSAWVDSHYNQVMATKSCLRGIYTIRQILVKVSYLHMTKFSQIGPIPFLWHNLSD